MLVTRADAWKRQLVDLLQAQTQTGELLYQVQVEYEDPAQETMREVVYPGAVTTEAAEDPEIRLERFTLPLFILVSDPAKTPRETDQRAVAIGEAAQDVLEANQYPFGVNISFWSITGTELVGLRTGDESRTVLTLTVAGWSYL